MSRKFLCLLLSLVVLSSSLFTVASAAELGTIPESHPISTGVLTTDDGTEYIIQGVPVSTTNSRSLNESSVTYKYDLPAVTRAGGSQQEYSEDDSLSSTVYLTIYYNHQNTPIEYLLTRVSGYWEITGTNVSVESAYLTYGCSGWFPSAVEQDVQNSPVSNYFNRNTGFDTYVCSDAGGVMGAYLTLNYLMGNSRRWSFTLNNYRFGMP